MARSRVLIIIFISLAFIATGARADDLKGSRDHRLFERFTGSEIIGYIASDYDEFKMGLGKAYEISSGKYGLKKSEAIEGRVTRILYLLPEGKSTLHAYRSYEKMLKRAGAKPLFACKGNAECGWHSWFSGSQTLGGLREYAMQLGDDYRYMGTKIPGKNGDIYVSLMVYQYSSSAVLKWQGRTMVELNVIETGDMKEEMSRVTAEDLEKGIRADGHVAVGQIYFDTNSDKLQPSSDASLAEVAKLLKNNPDLQVMFIGHTDNQGDFQNNMDLSQRRAKAVMTAMEKVYGINRAQVGAAGLGSMAPVATNRTEEGRAKNRRVEIIEQ